MSPPSTRFGRLLGVIAVAGVLTGCGSSGSGPSKPDPGPLSNPRDFPSSAGKTLGTLLSGLPTGPELALGVGVIRPGTSRFSFALIDPRMGQPISGVPVALYTGNVNGTGLRGPLAVRDAPLTVKPQFQSRTTADDPGSAKRVYVTQVSFPRPGDYGVVALIRQQGRLVASSAIKIRVGDPGPPPVGAVPPRIHTPTVASVGGDVSKIDTRLPPDDMHAVDFASVLGRKPIVLVFATPQLCKSRVCGPIVDAVEQVKSELGDRAAFIHMEIYNDNRVERGYRPQFRAFRLPSEPWLFAIDRRGRIVEELLEGPASVAEVQAAAERAIHG